MILHFLSLIHLLPSLFCSDIPHSADSYHDNPILLTEDKALLHQTLKHGQSAVYTLTNLTPGELYEFKVSYPASQPYSFTISFSSTLATMIPQRKLLDIEKEEFTSDTDTLYVTVTAHDVSRSVKPAPHVQYSVYYERVYHGIPAQAFRLIAWLCVVIPVGVFVANWVFNNWYDLKHEHVS